MFSAILPLKSNLEKHHLFLKIPNFLLVFFYYYYDFLQHGGYKITNENKSHMCFMLSFKNYVHYFYLHPKAEKLIEHKLCKESAKTIN